MSVEGGKKPGAVPTNKELREAKKAERHAKLVLGGTLFKRGAVAETRQILRTTGAKPNVIAAVKGEVQGGKAVITASAGGDETKATIAGPGQLAVSRAEERFAKKPKKGAVK